MKELEQSPLDQALPVDLLPARFFELRDDIGVEHLVRLFVELGETLGRTDVVVPALDMCCLVDEFENGFGYHMFEMPLILL